MRGECILRDISFYGCIELVGPREAVLASLVAACWAPPVRPAAWLNGAEHAILLRGPPTGEDLYAGQRSPKTHLADTADVAAAASASASASAGSVPAASAILAPLAPATVLARWAPEQPDVQCWVWVHPAATTAALLSLTAAVAETAASHGGHVKVSDRSSELLRLRLRGPGSTGVLARSLHLVDAEADNLAADGLGTSRAAARRWAALVAGLSSPALLAPGSALGLVVWDPRLKPTRAATKDLCAPPPAAPQSRTQLKELVAVSCARTCRKVPQRICQD